MWRIDVQLGLLCIAMPPAGCYAVKYIYRGPAAVERLSVDLVASFLLTLCGFVPGVVHALFVLAREKGWLAAAARAVARRARAVRAALGRLLARPVRR